MNQGVKHLQTTQLSFYKPKDSNKIQNTKTISGLACNIDKTNVIPIGKNTNIAYKLCLELNMEWTKTFTILGFEIDSILANQN